MKLAKCFELQEKLVKKLGDDLVISLALVKGEYILTISAHASDSRQFSHGKHMQRAILTPQDLQRSVDQVVEEVVSKIIDLLVNKEPQPQSLEEIQQENKDFAQQANRKFAEKEVAYLGGPKSNDAS